MEYEGESDDEVTTNDRPPSMPPRSTSNVLGLPEHFGVSSEEEEDLAVFGNRCASLINGILGGKVGLSEEAEGAASAVLTGLAALLKEDPSTERPTARFTGSPAVWADLGDLVRGTVAKVEIPQVMAEAEDIVREAGPVKSMAMPVAQAAQDSSSQGSWPGGARQRGGGDEEERAIAVAGEAVAAAERGEPQRLADMGANVVEAAAPVVEQSVAAAGIAPGVAVDPARANAAAANARLAVAGVEEAVQGSAIRSALQAVGQGLSCGLRAGGGAIQGGGLRIIQAIRGAGGATVYQIRQRMAAFTAGVVALGTWAAGYWGPDNVARSTCMTVLTPFMTRYGAGPWCGVEVQPQGMFHAAQQFAASLAPGGAFWETLGIFGTATTERYDIAARAVFATVTALVVIGFGSWTGLLGAVGRPLRRATGNALGAVNQYFTGARSAEETLRDQLQSTYEALANAWVTPDVGAEANFQACLAIAVALGATPARLEDQASIFEGRDVAAELDPRTQQVTSPAFEASVLGFNFGPGEDAAPTHTSATDLHFEGEERGWVPGPQLVESMRRFLTTDAVATAISNLPPPAAAIGGGARRKYMQLRSLLQLAAVTAGALARAREGPAAISNETQTALQTQFQRTMETYRDMRINSLLAAEDLAVAFATNAGQAIMQGQPAPEQPGGGRRRRRTRRSKPRSRARRKGNKRKTRVGKRRRTRRH